MSTALNITRRERRRRLKSGVVIQTRYVIGYRELRTGKRIQLFFERRRDAELKRNEIAAALESGTYAAARARESTVREVIDRFLVNSEHRIKRITLGNYRRISAHVVGPLLMGTADERSIYQRTGRVPPGTHLVPLLGDLKVQDVSTGDIRNLHRLLVEHVGRYTAGRALTFLHAALKLAAEDLGIRPPAMPSNLGKGRPKSKKAILMPDQVAELLRLARADRERGLYIGFPFLTGVRPSEQLGLLWEDVDFDRNVIRIRRMQEVEGTLSELTKTAAGTREIPMAEMLRTWLLEWRLMCPRHNGELHRVFPGPGTARTWPLPRIGGGGPLLYANFRKRVWIPFLTRAGLPQVTPHSARHCFISTMQAQGIEVAVVAKLAGHANATITLSHYTQAVRGAEGAVAALERAFTGP